MTDGYKIKKIYVGTNLVRPKRTFTISWEEKSNMSSGWTYSDDAAGLMAGSTAFDEFFGYSGVRLSTAGVETNEITQTDSGGAGKLDITQLGTITSGDNVMIKFPVRGIKMTKSGSKVTLSITEKLNEPGYQYYAHSTGTLSSPGTPKSAFYLGAYECCNSSNVLKSWSGQTPAVSLTHSVLCARAKANGTGYNIMGFYHKQYLSALYMMKYGNPNSQSVVGMGYVSASSKAFTGGTDSQTNATYGTSSQTTQMKLFGLEDRWGNVGEAMGGAYFISGQTLYVQLSGYSGTASGGESTGATVLGNNQELSSIIGDNKGMFMQNSVVSNSSYNTYYCDNVQVNVNNPLLNSGGVYADTTWAGVFKTTSSGVSSSGTAFGARLLYLN